MKRPRSSIAVVDLVDGLKEMIKSKRLVEQDIPDDFAWLLEVLEVADEELDE